MDTGLHPGPINPFQEALSRRRMAASNGPRFGARRGELRPAADTAQGDVVRWVTLPNGKRIPITAPSGQRHVVKNPGARFYSDPGTGEPLEIDMLKPGGVKSAWDGAPVKTDKKTGEVFKELPGYGKRHLGVDPHWQNEQAQKALKEQQSAEAKAAKDKAAADKAAQKQQQDDQAAAEAEQKREREMEKIGIGASKRLMTESDSQFYEEARAAREKAALTRADLSSDRKRADELLAKLDEEYDPKRRGNLEKAQSELDASIQAKAARLEEHELEVIRAAQRREAWEKVARPAMERAISQADDESRMRALPNTGRRAVLAAPKTPPPAEPRAQKPDTPFPADKPRSALDELRDMDAALAKRDAAVRIEFDAEAVARGEAEALKKRLPAMTPLPGMNVPRDWLTPPAHLARQTAREVGKADMNLPPDYDLAAPDVSTGGHAGEQALTWKGIRVGGVRRDARGVARAYISGVSSPSLDGGTPFDGVPEYAHPPEDFRAHLTTQEGYDANDEESIREAWEARHWTAGQVRKTITDWQNANDDERADMLLEMQPERASEIAAWRKNGGSLPLPNLRSLHQSGFVSRQEARLLDRVFSGAEPGHADLKAGWEAFKKDSTSKAAAVYRDTFKLDPLLGGGSDVWRRQKAAGEAAAAQYLADYFQQNNRRPDFDLEAFNRERDTLLGGEPVNRFRASLEDIGQNVLGSMAGIFTQVGKAATLQLSEHEMEMIGGQTRGAMWGFGNFLKDVFTPGSKNNDATAAADELFAALDHETLTDARLRELTGKIQQSALAYVRGEDLAENQRGYYDALNPESPLAAALMAYKETRDPAYKALFTSAMLSTPGLQELQARVAAHASDNGMIAPSDAFALMRTSFKGAQVAPVQETALEIASNLVGFGVGKLVKGGVRGAKVATAAGRGVNAAQRALLKYDDLAARFAGWGTNAATPVRNMAVQGAKVMGASAGGEAFEEGVMALHESGATFSDVWAASVQGALGGMMLVPMFTSGGAAMNAAQKLITEKRGLNAFVKDWNAARPDDPLIAKDARQLQGYLPVDREQRAFETLRAAATEMQQHRADLVAAAGGEEQLREIEQAGHSHPQWGKIAPILEMREASQQRVRAEAAAQSARVEQARAAMQEVNGIADPTLRAFADAALRHVSGHTLTPQERAILESARAGVPAGPVPKVDVPVGDPKKGATERRDAATGTPLAQVGRDGSIILTQRGLDALATAMPRTARALLPVDERSQWEAWQQRQDEISRQAAQTEPQAATSTDRTAGGNPQRNTNPVVTGAGVNAPGEMTPRAAGVPDGGANTQTTTSGPVTEYAPQTPDVPHGTSSQVNPVATYTVPVTVRGKQGTTSARAVSVSATSPEEAAAKVAAMPVWKAMRRGGAQVEVGAGQSAAGSGQKAVSQQQESQTVASQESASQPEAMPEPTNEAESAEAQDAAREQVRPLARVLREAAAGFGYKIVDTGLPFGFTDRYGTFHSLGTQIFDKAVPGSELGQWIDKIANSQVADHIRENMTSPGLHRVWFGHDPLASIGAVVERFGITALPEYAVQLLKDMTTKSGIPLPGVQWLVHKGVIGDRAATEWLSLNVGEALGAGLGLLGTYKLYKRARNGQDIHAGWVALGIAFKITGGVLSANPVLLISGLADTAILVAAKRGTMKAGLQKLRQEERRGDGETGRRGEVATAPAVAAEPVDSGQSPAGGEQKAETKAAPKALMMLKAAVKHRAGAFDQVEAGPVASGGGMEVVRGGDGKITLRVDTSRFMRHHAGSPKALIEQLVDHEVIHAGTLREFTDAEIASLWSRLPERLRHNVYAAYHAAEIMAGELPRRPARADLAAMGVSLGHEMLRMLLEDRVFQREITEAAQADPGLAAEIVAFLKRLVSRLRGMIEGADPELRALVEWYESRAVDALERLGVAGKGAKPPPTRLAGEVRNTGQRMERLRNHVRGAEAQTPTWYGMTDDGVVLSADGRLFKEPWEARRNLAEQARRLGRWLAWDAGVVGRLVEMPPLTMEPDAHTRWFNRHGHLIDPEVFSILRTADDLGDWSTAEMLRSQHRDVAVGTLPESMEQGELFERETRARSLEGMRDAVRRRLDDIAAKIAAGAESLAEAKGREKLEALLTALETRLLGRRPTLGQLFGPDSDARAEGRTQQDLNFDAETPPAAENEPAEETATDQAPDIEPEPEGVGQAMSDPEPPPSPQTITGSNEQSGSEMPVQPEAQAEAGGDIDPPAEPSSGASEELKAAARAEFADLLGAEPVSGGSDAAVNDQEATPSASPSDGTAAEWKVGDRVRSYEGVGTIYRIMDGTAKLSLEPDGRLGRWTNLTGLKKADEPGSLPPATDERAETDNQKKVRKAKENARKRKKGQPESQPTTESTPAAMIGDFGEKIGGARKDAWKIRGLNVDDLGRMTTEERDGYTTKDQVWPKPDYAQWVKDGMDPVLAYQLKTIRDGLSAKPDFSKAGYFDTPEQTAAKREKEREQYVTMLGIFRDRLPAMRDWKEFEALMSELWGRDQPAYGGGTGRAVTTWSDESHGVFTGRDRAGRKKWNNSVWYPSSVQRKARAFIERTGWPVRNEPWMRFYDVNESKPGSVTSSRDPATGEWVSKTLTESEFFVSPRGGYSILAQGFLTRDLAEAWAAAKYEADQKNKTQGGGKVTRPLNPNPQRTGEDYRKGVDVTGQDLLDTFGFRGGEFGNWTNQADRQQALNAAFDALHDLARVMGVPPKAMSLGGKMGIAFGARGKGKAAAHYEPVKLVINLTRTSGAGALAHEWGHALDDHFGKLGGGSAGAMQTNRLPAGTLRPAMLKAWQQVWNALATRTKEQATVIAETKEKIARGQKSLQSWIPQAVMDNENTGPLVRMLMGALPKQLDSGPATFEEVAARLKQFWPKDVKAYPTKGITQNGSFIAHWENRLARAEAGMIRGEEPTKFITDAKEIGEYWERKHELFARAFESWVQSRIEATGAKSEYLVHSTVKATMAGGLEGETDSDAKARDKWASAYPQGRDAVAIWAAFDQFKDTLESVEQEDGSVTLRAPLPAGSEVFGRRKLPPEKRDGFIRLAGKMDAEGVNTPEKLAAFLDETFPGGAARPYSQALWTAIGVVNQDALDTAGRVDWAAVYGQKSNNPETGGQTGNGEQFSEEQGADSTQQGAAQRAVDVIARRIRDGAVGRRERMTQPELVALAEKATGRKIGPDFTIKDVYDLMELAVNRVVLESTAMWDVTTADAGEAVKAVTRLKEQIIALLPTMSRRTEEMDAMQQFSTPPSLSYAAAWVANLRGPEVEDYRGKGGMTKRRVVDDTGDVLLEPSAGLGGLAMWGKQAGAEVIANELSKRRHDLLKQSGIADTVTNENAELLHAIYEPRIAAGEMRRPTVVVMNPPFSNAATSKDKSTKIGALHVEQALRLLPAGGRLVAIVGRGMSDDAPAFKAWWARMKRDYAVRANIRVDGKEYQRYGTTFDNQLVVIDKLPPGDNTTVTGEVATVEELIPLLAPVRHARGNQRTEPAADQSAGPQSPEAAESGGDSRADTSAGARPGGARGGRPRSGRKRGQRGDAAAGGVGTKPEDTGNGVALPESGDGRSEPTAGDDTGGNLEPDTGSAGTGLVRADTGGTDAASRAELSDDDIFATYTPRKAVYQGAHSHPSPLVESAAMASVEAPDVTYTPKLDAKVISEGRLSDAQLEAVTYAGQAHQRELATGERAGFFIGDGTGVGKGRELAGIIADNWNQGRKRAVWISKSKNLAKDARRDLDGLGLQKAGIIELGKVKTGAPIEAKEGVLFATYATLKGAHDGLDDQKQPKGAKGKPSRMQQLYNWLGKDYDGVIALDEAHMAGNAMDMKGNRGMKKASATGLAVVDLQAMFPKARVVYASATGATEPSNFSYAARLGLWGPGTAFANREKFFQEIAAQGVSAMEVLARDLKALGSYIARTLSFKGVDFTRVTHEVTPEQRKIYDQMAESWQMVYANVDQAMGITGANKYGKARSAAMSAFWSANQRFFNQILTAMQMPSVLADMKAKLDAGGSVVVQLTNTNEAIQERALAQREDEADEESGTNLDNLDLSPKDVLLKFVQNSWPTAKYIKTVDDNGNEKWTVALDANNKPVIDPDAVALREQTLSRLASLRVPENPLEQLLETFGAENVSEITGRSRRVVSQPQADGTRKRVIEDGRSDARRLVESREFQDGKRRVLVFSDAGGTGFSYHAATGAKNRQRRYHYLVQAGWRADTALQGFGRTHRSDQVQTPFYVLASTDIKGHQRFISTIARRLAQLGALTTGERKAAGQGMFSETDNLESSYARTAVKRLFYDLFANRVPGFDFADITMKMGYVRREVNEKTGNTVAVSTLIDQKQNTLDEGKLPTIQQFLNRILAVNIEEQNRLFEAFMERMERGIAAAKEGGHYDPGTQTFKADKIEATGGEQVYTHPGTSAGTRIEAVKASRRIHYTPFDFIARRKPEMYVRNLRSGRVYALADGGHRTTESGAIVDLYARISPTGSENLPRMDVHLDGEKANYEKLSEAQTRELWTREITEGPEFSEDSDHFLVGMLLPIWDRAKMTVMRIFRVNPENGTPFLGLHIHPKELDAVRARLGAGAVKKTPAQWFADVIKQGKTLDLANGWRVQRARSLGDYRLEVVGPQWENKAEFESWGGFTERVSWTLRWFMPGTEAEGAAALEKLITRHPVVSGADELTLGAPTPWEKGDAIKFIPLQDLDGAMQRLEDWMWRRHREWRQKSQSTGSTAIEDVAEPQGIASQGTQKTGGSIPPQTPPPVNPENSGAEDRALRAPVPARPATAHQANIVQQGAKMRNAAAAPAQATGGKLPTARGATHDAGSLLRDLFYGRHDALEAIMPGTKRLIQENRLDAGFARAAVTAMMDQVRRRIEGAFGSPKFWNVKRKGKMTRFLSELLPVASRLNATGYTPAGALVFSDFDRPIGFISDAEMAANNYQVGDAVPLPGSASQQLVNIGPRATERGGHVLTEPMPASTQAQIFTDFSNAYPEGAWVVEEFVMPGLEQVREVGPGGTTTPAFNRGSILNFLNDDWPPALQALFTAQPLPPVALTEGWTPDMARQKTAAAYLGALLRTFIATARKTRTGERIESGDLHDLLDGFEIAAFEGQMEKSRLVIRNKLINQTATAAPPPASGLREYLSQWTPLDDVIHGTIKAYVLTRKADLKLIPDKGKPLTAEQRALATRLLGDGVRFWGTDMALPRRIYQEFIAAEARDVVTNRLLRAVDWFIKRYVAGLMVDLGTFFVNVASNPVLRQMAGMNRLAYAMTSAAHGDWAGAKLGALEWAHLMRGLVMDQLPLLNKRILSALPPEIYDDNTTYAQADGIDPMKGALAELKDFNPGAAFLKTVRYGSVDQGAKVGVHYALLRARASVAADKARVKGAARKAFITDWMNNARTRHRQEFEETYQQTLDFMLDMANDVPAIIDPSQNLFTPGGQPSQLEKVIKRGVFSLFRYKAAMVRYGVRNTIGSARALMSPALSAERKAQAAANLLMMAGLAAFGWLLTGDEDDDPLVGRQQDDYGRLLPQSVRTGDRVNLSRAGRMIAGWLRRHGVPIREDGTVEPGATEEDLWVKTSKLPLTSSAILLGHLLNGEVAEAMSATGQFWTDLQPTGPLVRLNPLTYDASYFDQGKSYRVVAADQLFDMLTAPILPSRLRESVVRIVDPQDRLLKPEPDIGYNPGLREVFETNIPWLSLMVPPRATYESAAPTRFSATAWRKEKLAAIARAQDLTTTERDELRAEVDARFPALLAAAAQQRELLEGFGIPASYIDTKRTGTKEWPAELQALKDKGYDAASGVVSTGEQTITRDGVSSSYARLFYPDPATLGKKTGANFLLVNLTGLNLLPVRRGALHEELNKRKVSMERKKAADNSAAKAGGFKEAMSRRRQP